MDDVVHVLLDGKLAKYLVKINSSVYRKYVTTVSGKTITYMKLRKALYG